MTFKWVTSDGDVDMLIKPDQYLFEESTTGYCVCLIVETDSTYDMVLGLPFFRSFKVGLDFENNEVALYTKDDFSPLNPFPNTDPAFDAEQ
jgi:hypothetical protein